MVVPKLSGMDITGVAALALRAFIVSQHGEQGLRDMLYQRGAAAALDTLNNLDYSSVVPWATVGRIMGCVRDHFNTEVSVMAFEYGKFFFSWIVLESGYEQSVFQISDNFVGFAKSLNRLLLQMFVTLDKASAGLTFKPHYVKVSPTSFDFCGFVLPEPDCNNPSTALHMMMHRGILTRAAAQVFGLDLDFSSPVVRSLPSGKQLMVSQVSFQPRAVPTIPHTALQEKGTEAGGSIPRAVGLGPDSFGAMFPFHFVLDLELRVLQAGRAIQRLMPRMVPGVHISEVLMVCVPDIPWDLDYLNVHVHNSMHSKVILNSRRTEGLAFRGCFNRVPAGAHIQAESGCRADWGEALLFLGSPLLSSVEEIRQHKLYVSDFPPHDMTADHILMDATQHNKAACTLRLAQERNVQLEAALADALSTQDFAMSRPKLDTTSVADLILGLLDGLILGDEITTQEVLAVRKALLQAEGTNMWSPMVLDARAIDGDDEVNESLGRMLGASCRRGPDSVDRTQEGREGATGRSAPPRRKLSRAISLVAGRKSLDNGPTLLSGAASSSELRLSSQPGQPAAPSRADDSPQRLPHGELTPSSQANALPHATQLPAEATGSAAAGCAGASAPTSSQPNARFRGQSGTEESSSSSAACVPAEKVPEVDSSSPGAVATAAPSPSCLSWFQTKLRFRKGSSETKSKKGKVQATTQPAPDHVQSQTDTPGTTGSAPQAGCVSLQPVLSAAAAASPAGRPAAAQPLAVVVQAALVTQLLQQPSDNLAAALSCVDKWQFDAFRLEQAASGRPLSCLAFFLIKRMDLIRSLSLNEHKLSRFLLRIEAGYPNHPYHNRTHAADVLRSLYVVMTQGGVMEALKVHGPWSSGAHTSVPQDAAGMLSVMLAAIVHDYEHKGVNNDFLIRSFDPLAMLYNDISPLENHHVAASMSLMRVPEYAFLPPTSDKLQGLLRKDIIDMVLATDMKQHFALSGTFSTKVAQQAPHDPAAAPPRSQPTQRRNQSNNLRKMVLKERAHMGDSVTSSDAPLAEPPETWDHGTQMLVLKMALKCSDLGHLTSTTSVHRKWVGRLEEELFRQGDQERALGQPVSALMDRTKTGITKSQCGFINVVAQPMYELMAQAFPACNQLVTNLKCNVEFWKTVESGVDIAGDNALESRESME